MYKLLIALTMTLFLVQGIAQTCDVSGPKDWKNVELREMKEKQEKLKGYKLAGEGILKFKKKISSMADLTQDMETEIRKYAAKYKGCVVYIDVHRFWDSGMMEAKEVYFYWLNPKE